MNENEKLIQSIIEAIQEKKGRNIVHVFIPDFRQRYNLEQLWADARINEIPNLD